MQAFPLVDAHLHIWDLRRFRYPWLDGIPALNRTFLLGDYLYACENIPVEKMVFVQCECEPSQSMREVEWVTEVAAAEPRIRGIVSWAPLENGKAALQELETLSRNKLVKGIRRIIQFEDDPEFCLRPGFIEGVRTLPQFGFTFDLCISYRNNRNAIKLIDRCQDVRIILDHIGKPDIKGGRLEPWRHEIREMAAYPNVFCKVSSLATEANHDAWTVDGLRPYAECVFESFGFDRVVFASDWPVSSQAASIPVCIQTLETLLKGQPDGNFRKLFHDNAELFYGV